MQGILFPSSTGQIVDLCSSFCTNQFFNLPALSRNFRFCFKNYGWGFGVVTSRGSQMKTASQDYKLKKFHIFLCHLKELNALIKNNIKAISKKTWNLV